MSFSFPKYIAYSFKISNVTDFMQNFVFLFSQKAAHNLMAGNLHKTGTAFVTLGENGLGFVQVAHQKT